MQYINLLIYPQRMIEGRHGFFVYSSNDTYIGKSLELYGEYCEHEVVLFSKLVNEGDIVIEIGANVGSQTVPLSRICGNTGMVYAFEPQPVLFQNLCANLSVNGLQNVRAFPFACGDNNGHCFLPAVNYNQISNFGSFGMASEGTEKVILIKLDGWFADKEKIKLLKIDAEGMEGAVVSGLSETIGHCRPFLYVENDRIDKSKALIELIWSLGYKIYWHLPYYYNARNFYKNSQNIFPNQVAVNMLCIPNEMINTPADLPLKELITDSNFHPMNRK
ncbi:MAG: FkbM family methyltransferase [Desulfamplus sp.]|nr:FkbM family methyltransferase [Desulfamplus sp.]